MNRTIIQCTLCPCRFLTQIDYSYHLEAFTGDPFSHIKKFVDGTSYPPGKKHRLRRELYKKYLVDKGIKIPSKPRRRREHDPSMDMKEADR